MTANNLLKLAILISGRGSNMQAIHRSILQGTLQAQISLIISNRPEAAGLNYAKEQDIPCQVILKEKNESRTEYDQKLIRAIDGAEADLVVLAGYMRLLSPEFVQHYYGRLVNIHPSLLPAFPGLDAQKQALESGVPQSGCTVHFVDEGCDSGPIIAQRRVPVKPDDTEASLSDRILKEEHHLFSECLQLFAEGRVRLDGRNVIIK